MINSKNAIIKFIDLDFRYGSSSLILNDINLEINSGEFYFLTGKSGAGKSSLLKLMYLGALPSKGELELFGKLTSDYNHNDISLMRQSVSIIFQDHKLLPHLNAFDNVALPLRIKGEKESDINYKVQQMIAWVGLKDFADYYPNELSGGQQQRLSIARSVVSAPKLILADEPTGSVDEATSQRIMSLFEQLHKAGTTIIMATHNQHLVDSKKYPELHIENGNLMLNKKGNF